MEIINSWQFNLILSIVFIVLFTQFFKLASKNQKNDGAMAVLAQIISGVSVLVLIPFFEFKFPTDWKVWGLLGLAIIFYAINDRIHATTRKNLDVSTENILNQLSKVFMIVTGIVFFKEDIILIKILGGLLIILSNVLLVFNKGKFVFNKYVLLQLLRTLFYTIALSLDVGISEQFNLPIYIALTFLVPALLIILFERIPPKKIVEEYKEGNKKAITITGLSWGLSVIFGLRAYQYGEVTTIAPLSALALLFNVIFAYVFLKEKNDIIKKVVAAIGVIAGVILISLAS